MDSQKNNNIFPFAYKYFLYVKGFYFCIFKPFPPSTHDSTYEVFLIFAVQEQSKFFPIIKKVDDTQHYLLKEALGIIPVSLIIGKIIKQTLQISNWLIPFILIFYITFTIYLIGTNLDAILQSILLKETAVNGNQLFQQTKRRNKG